MNDLGPDAETQVRDRLAAARQEHADLDVAVQAISAMPTPSLGVLGRFKRRNLGLKDEIACLEDQLTAESIA